MEVYLKISLAVLVLAQGSIRLYYMRQYQLSHQHLQKSREPAFEKGLGIFLGIVYSVPLVVWGFTPFWDFAQASLPTWVRFCGVGIGALSIGLFYVSHRDLGKNWSPLLEVREHHTLIRQGIFRYMRHPMYASLLLGVWALCFITANVVCSIFVLLGVGIFVAVRIPREETLMLEQFGEEYLAYMKNTKRLVPFVF